MQTRSRARAAAQDLSGGEPAEGKVGSDIVTAVNSDTYAQRNSDGVSTVADASTTRQTRTKRPAANEARKLGNPKRRSKRQRVVAGDRPQDEATVCNTGLFSKLPTEIVEEIFNHCQPRQLAIFRTLSRWFRDSPSLDESARQRLRQIPRAKGFEPEPRRRDDWVRLLHFFTAQSAAAAQSTAIALGAHHSAALLVQEDSTSSDPRWDKIGLFTWGRGFHGQLGSDTYEDRDTPGAIELEQSRTSLPAVVSCGNSHTLCITRRGELFSWGLSSSGELGHGGCSPTEMPIPRRVQDLSRTRIVSMSAGANHSLAIAEDGSLWTCGRGRNGQLGHGGFTDEAPLQCVDALKGTRIVSTAAGVAHSVALASDGTLFTWGDGRYGQLGHPALETLQYAVENIALAKPWKLATLEPRMLKPHERVTAVSAGGYHTLAVTVGGELKVWGRNDRGQLGLGGRKLRSQSQPYKKAVWTPTSAVITDVSAPRCSDVRVVQAVAGYSHSLILLHCNGVPAVLSTGSNFFGQLGHGDTLSRNEFTRINALSGQNIMSLSSGDYHCAAIGPEGGLYVWGRGDSGQLGITSKKSSWTPRRLPGLNVVHPDRTLRRKGGNTCKIPKSQTEIEEDIKKREAPLAPQKQMMASFLGIASSTPANTARA